MFLIIHKGWLGIQQGIEYQQFKGLGFIRISAITDPLSGIRNGALSIPMVPRTPPFEELFMSEEHPAYIKTSNAIAGAYFRMTIDEIALWTANSASSDRDGETRPEKDHTVLDYDETTVALIPTVMLNRVHRQFMEGALLAGATREQISELAQTYLIGNHHPVLWFPVNEIREKLVASMQANPAALTGEK